MTDNNKSVNAENNLEVKSDKEPFFNKKRKDFIFIWGMLAIAIINFFAFWLFPNVRTIFMAFEKPTQSGKLVFTFEYFVQIAQELFKTSGKMFGAFKNTMLAFLINNFISFPITIICSYFLFKKVRCYRLFRIVFFLPSIVSAVVMVTLFKYFIGVDGPLQKLYELFGGVAENYPMFLTQPSTAFMSLLVYEIWAGIGYSVIILSGALYRIPTEIFESAKLDGVNLFKEFVNIVIPLIWPTLSTYIVFKIAGVFTYTGPIMLFTNGAYNTYTIGFYIFEQVKYWNQLYYPSAVSLFWTALGIPLVFVCKWLIENCGTEISY